MKIKKNICMNKRLKKTYGKKNKKAVVVVNAFLFFYY